jgi:hypothetical protein
MLQIGLIGSIFAYVPAARLHIDGPRLATPMGLRTATVKASGVIEDMVAKQAAEIAELRSQLEAMKDDLWLAAQSQPAPPTEPPKKGGPRKAPVYTLYGSLPPDFDAAPIEALIARRVTARLKKHYSEADRLQTRILRLGVKLDDPRKTWSLTPGWQEKQAALIEEDQQGWRKQQTMQADLEKRIKKLFQVRCASRRAPTLAPTAHSLPYSRSVALSLMCPSASLL